MNENKTTYAGAEINGTAAEESVESLKARIAELESANKKLSHDVEIWNRLYNDEKKKQECQTKLTKTLMEYVDTVL